MAVKEIDANISELKRLLKADKVILGTDRTLKLLKLGTVDRVFLSCNCPEDIKKDIEYYANLSTIQLIYLKQPNDELGILCKKPYPVSVLSVTQ